MDETMQKTGWAVGIAGAASILLGVVLMIWPEPTVKVLIAAFGIFSLVWGIVLVVSAVANRDKSGFWALLLLVGILSGLFGLFLLGAPGYVTLSILLLLIALRAFVVGSIALVIGIQSFTTKDKQWFIFISGIVSLLFGMLVLVDPYVGARLAVLFMSVYLILDGAFMLATGASYRSTAK